MATADDDALIDGDRVPAGPSILGPGLAVCCGLATMALTTGLVYWLGSRFPDFNIMEWYYKRIVPVGPLVIGVAAGCGYGFGCWIAGERVRILFLVLLVALQTWAYLMIQYETYQIAAAKGPPAATETFFQYFDRTTQKRLLINELGQIEGFVGVLGYGNRLMELLGFTFGGIVVPLGLMWFPYCEHCGCYIRAKTLGSLPAGVAPRKIRSPEDQRAYDRQASEAMAEGRRIIARLRDHVDAGRADLVAGEFAAYAGCQKRILKDSHRFDVYFECCPRCGDGYLRVRLLTGKGDKTVAREAVDWPADPELLKALWSN